MTMGGRFIPARLEFAAVPPPARQDGGTAPYIPDLPVTDINV